MNCHICAQPSIGQCQSCWKFYCSEHGDVLCRECKDKAPGWPGSRGLAYGTGGFVAAVGADPDEPPPDIEAMIKAAGIPMKRVLSRVVPVTQTQTAGDTRMTIVSLELYEDAFVARVRLNDLEERPDNPFLAMGMPNLSLEAVDDTGQAYAGYQGGGGGGDSDFHFEFNFTPAIPDDARVVTITSSGIHWMVVGPGQRSRFEPGPWHFEIPLA